MQPVLIYTSGIMLSCVFHTLPQAQSCFYKMTWPNSLGYLSEECSSAYNLCHRVANRCLYSSFWNHFWNFQPIPFDLQKTWVRPSAQPFPSPTDGTLLHLPLSQLPIHKWKGRWSCFTGHTRTKWPNVYTNFLSLSLAITACWAIGWPLTTHQNN